MHLESICDSNMMGGVIIIFSFEKVDIIMCHSQKITLHNISNFGLNIYDYDVILMFHFNILG